METKRFKLPKKFAKNWIAALRSGKYKQDCNHAQYRWEGLYCAVGVAAIANGIEFQNDNRAMIGDVDINIWLGSSFFAAIYTLNDSQRKTFAEIADWIELNVKF